MRRAIALVSLLAAGTAAAQESPLAPSPTNLIYARSMGMGAYRGVAGSNDAIFYNPAALAANKAFTVELGGLMYRVGADTDATMFGGTVVDSVSSPVTGGFAYNYTSTLGYRGNGFWGGMTNVALAFPLGSSLFVGTTFTYLNLKNDYGVVSCITMNAALFMKLGKFFSLGGTGYNLINTHHPELLPIGLGVGAAAGPDNVFHIVGDWYREWAGDGRYRDVWSAGAEFFLFDVAAVRGGWIYDAGRNIQWWSIGAGFAYEGIGADFAYRQGFGGGTYRMLGASLRFNVPGM